MYNEAKCGTSSRRMFGVGSDHSQNTYSNRECCDNFKHNMEILNRRFNRRNCKDSGKNVPTITPPTCPPTTFLGVAATLSGSINTIHAVEATATTQPSKNVTWIFGDFLHNFLSNTAVGLYLLVKVALKMVRTGIYSVDG